ncbi:MAG: hypothetical protein PHT71_09350 [Victivallaceae bacterium]|jgi:hypothetical protein|nr:hypothetical protein [Victivallaceae bacterium]
MYIIQNFYGLEVMSKRNDYISDNLIHAREKLKSYHQSLDNSNSTPGNSVNDEIPDEPQKPPKIGPKAFEDYHKARRESIRRLSEFSMLLAAQREMMEQNSSESAKIQTMFEQLYHELNQLPDTLDELNNFPEKFDEYQRHNEQARLMLMRHSAAVKRLLENDPKAVANTISIVHEVASLSFWQLFRLGFSMLMPLILSLIAAALAIGAAIILTMGGI